MVMCLEWGLVDRWAGLSWAEQNEPVVGAEDDAR